MPPVPGSRPSPAPLAPAAPIARFLGAVPHALLAGSLLLGACEVSDRSGAARNRSGEDSAASLFDDDPRIAPPGSAVPEAAAVEPAAGPRVRVVSLKAVDRLLAACPGEALCADSLFLRLGGITSITGIAFDERNRDALLL